MSEHFFSLTPERVLEAVERSGHATTGLCYPLNSLENRVYEVELDDRSRVIAKFYRPGRWSEAAIREEHLLLHSLDRAEIPVCCVTPFADGDTLHSTPDGIFYALFPRTGGRCPDELVADQLEQLGRLLARIHNVSASLTFDHRHRIAADTYGSGCLAKILEHAQLSPGTERRYRDAVEQLVQLCQPLLAPLPTFVVHGDCHRANLLDGRQGWFFLDFDDMGFAPAVQDLWLLLPARPRDCLPEVERMLAGYEQFRELPAHSMAAVEAPRGLRYVRYAAWVAERWDDPAFPRAFPDWGSEHYWEEQVADIYEQLREIQLQQQPGYN